MTCATVQQYLSAYHDNELSPELCAQVEDHVRSCDQCAAKLAAFREISRVAAQLRDPVPPAGMWDDLQTKLQRSKSRRQPAQPSVPLALLPSRRWAAAALLLLALSAALGGWLYWSNEHRQMGIAFSRFLDQFPHDPAAAQQILLTKYDGRPVTIDEATRQLKYRPALPAGEDGLQFEEMYVLRMPCCTCVETLFKTDDGQTLAIFEHHDEEPAWFANRPVIRAQCNGTRTSIVQVNDHLAASWRQDGRCLTVVGARDMDQVASLITGFRPPDTQ